MSPRTFTLKYLGSGFSISIEGILSKLYCKSSFIPFLFFFGEIESINCFNEAFPNARSAFELFFFFFLYIFLSADFYNML